MEFKRTHYGSLIADNKGLRVIRCHVCGYAHLEDLPNQVDVDSYYQTDQFYNQHSGGNTWFEENKREHEAGLWRTAYNYQGQQLTSPVLDYGCGDGWFLNTVHVGAGIEPSALARSYAKQSKIYPDLSYVTKNRFSSLRMALVLEHILQPYDLVYSLMDYMQPNHTIQIIVPNEFNPLQNKVRKLVGYDWFVQKPHINYFTKQTAIKLVERCGYYISDICGTFPIELFYLAGFKYIGNAEIGARVHNWRLQFERHMGVAAYKIYGVLYRKLGWGRESIITAKRKDQESMFCETKRK